MNLDSIPNRLRYLIPQAEKWGIADDGYRDEQIENSCLEDLQQLVNIFTEEITEIFNEWLSDEDEVDILSEEYLLFTCFFMAYEYADVIIKDRELV